MAEGEKRVLIINGDDLGYTCGVNNAIAECCTAGILRSCTLMANGAAFDHAVALARNTPKLDVGVHLVLTERPPISPPGRVLRLLDNQGRLPVTPRKLLVGLLRGRIDREAIWQELSCQITKVLDHGVQPTHLDSHKHVHVIPMVLEVVVELARKFAIPWVRNPFDETPFFPLARRVDRNKAATFCVQHLKGRLIRRYRSTFDNLTRASGVRAPDHFFGISLTGIWSEAAMIGLMKNLPRGVTEWMLHPGMHDEDLDRSATRLRAQREAERALLLAPQMQQHLAHQGITLSSFRTEVA
jgi:chitin disaccharide deacetylase